VVFRAAEWLAEQTTRPAGRPSSASRSERPGPAARELPASRP